MHTLQFLALNVLGCLLILGYSVVYRNRNTGPNDRTQLRMVKESIEFHASLDYSDYSRHLPVTIGGIAETITELFLCRNLAYLCFRTV